jgi:hypothetical protein
MPIVHECASEDCKVLTMGEFCLDHERFDERLESTRTAAVATPARRTARSDKHHRSSRRPRLELFRIGFYLLAAAICALVIYGALISRVPS